MGTGLGEWTLPLGRETDTPRLRLLLGGRSPSPSAGLWERRPGCTADTRLCSFLPCERHGLLVPTPVHKCLTCGHLGAEGCRGDHRAQGRGVRPLNKPLGTAALTRCWFCSAAQACPTLCNPMDCSTPGLPVHHQLPEFTQTHVH